MKQIPSARHEHGVDLLVGDKRKRTGFATALRKYTSVSLGRGQRVIPDAFGFNHDTKTVKLYEVVVTNPIDSKLPKLRALRDLLAANGWLLRLFINYPRQRPIEIEIDTGRMTERESHRVNEQLQAMWSRRGPT